MIVPEGKLVGGTFKTVPGCSSAFETGCVVAYSSFLEEPPAEALFGRPTSILGGGVPDVERPQVLCVNPTLLVQGPYAGPSFSYYPTFNAYGGEYARSQGTASSRVPRRSVPSAVTVAASDPSRPGWASSASSDDTAGVWSVTLRWYRRRGRANRQSRPGIIRRSVSCI